MKILHSQQSLTHVSTRYLVLLACCLFILSRFFIWTNPPLAFTEIIYSYMPYAHLWASGTRPYLDQWYEYPPATIPLFYMPHVIDMVTRFTPFHANYSVSYRGIMLLIDMALFVIILRSLIWSKRTTVQFLLAVLFYLGLTTKAHHFIFDTMDHAFAAAMVMGAVAPYVLLSVKKPDMKHRIGMSVSEGLAALVGWTGVFLAVALKYVNGPLLALYILLDRKKILHSAVLAALGALLVWGVPLAVYRSSLQVSLVYHQLRGVQIDSAAAIVIRSIDRYTRSERVIEVFKNYEIAGPITDQAKKILTYSFPAALGSFLLFGAYLLWRHNPTSRSELHFFSIHLTLGYILVFMVSAKVLSTPFLLWHLPFLALYPFRGSKRQLQYALLSTLVIFSSMTQLTNAEVLGVPIPLWMGWVRTLSFSGMLILWLRDSFQLGKRMTHYRTLETTQTT